MTELIFDKDEDWDKRILCLDESCIGTIGPDGKCRECGKPYDGPLDPATSVTERSNEKVEPAENIKPHTESDVPDEEWEKRVLCSDEACIGTIGADGKCRECGKAGK